MNEEYVIEQTVSVYKTLEQQTDFSPLNPVMTDTLTPFVRMVLDADRAGLDGDMILSDPRIVHIRPDMISLLNRAERDMEIYWSGVFTSSALPPDLTQFWYFENYRELVDLETDAFQNVPSQSHAPERVAFIGSGPLPLSGLLIHEGTGAAITCIDQDEYCHGAGSAFLRAAGMKAVSTSCLEAGERYDYAGHDLVFVASMAAGKEAIVDRILETAPPHVLIGVRSVQGVKRLLYEPVDTDVFERKGLVSVAFAAANDRTINCTHFFCRPLAEMENDLICSELHQELECAFL